MGFRKKGKKKKTQMRGKNKYMLTSIVLGSYWVSYALIVIHQRVIFIQETTSVTAHATKQILCFEYLLSADVIVIWYSQNPYSLIRTGLIALFPFNLHSASIEGSRFNGVFRVTGSSTKEQYLQLGKRLNFFFLSSKKQCNQHKGAEMFECETAV